MARKKKKKLTRVGLIIVVVLLIVCFCLFIYYKNNRYSISYDKEVTIGLNEEYYVNNNIKSIKNAKIVSNNDKVDTSKVGTLEEKVTIKDKFGRKKNITYKITVKDSNGPVINGVKRLITSIGKEIDLLEGISAKDDSGESITVKVDGEYDFNKLGNYKLNYIASDSSGNSSKSEFSLIVGQMLDSSKPIEKEFTTSKGFSGIVIDGITYIDGYLIANKSYSLPSTYNPGLLSMTKENADKMFADSRKQNLNIYISSGFRSYSKQKSIYERYVSYDGVAVADTYSARAGHSEHQSGLAFDVNQINSTFDNTKEAKWLHENCYKYGFILRYPKGKTNETGYVYESWHYRYVGVELATKLYNDGNWITMEDYFGIDSKYSK